MQVRQFEPRDLDRILTIERDSFTTEAWNKRLFLDYFRHCANLFFIATLGRRTVAYSITCTQSRKGELVSIAVSPRDRRQGVAQALLDFTVAQLRRDRIREWSLAVAVDNTAGIQFYEKYGFKRMRLVKGYYGAGKDAWRMHMQL